MKDPRSDEEQPPEQEGETPGPRSDGREDAKQTFRSTDVDESEEQVKATAGVLHSVLATNAAASERWLKFYNDTAASVTVGTSAVQLTIGVPAKTTARYELDLVSDVPDAGVAFSRAISVACTTGQADSDTGAPATNDVTATVVFS